MSTGRGSGEPRPPPSRPLPGVHGSRRVAREVDAEVGGPPGGPVRPGRGLLALRALGLARHGPEDVLGPRSFAGDERGDVPGNDGPGGRDVGTDRLRRGRDLSRTSVRRRGRDLNGTPVTRRGRDPGGAPRPHRGDRTAPLPLGHLLHQPVPQEPPAERTPPGGRSLVSTRRSSPPEIPRRSHSTACATSARASETPRCRSRWECRKDSNTASASATSGASAAWSASASATSRASGSSGGETWPSLSVSAASVGGWDVLFSRSSSTGSWRPTVRGVGRPTVGECVLGGAPLSTPASRHTARASPPESGTLEQS